MGPKLDRRGFLVAAGASVTASTFSGLPAILAQQAIGGAQRVKSELTNEECREAETASAGFPSEKVGLSIAREFPPRVRIQHAPGQSIVNRFAYTPNIAAHDRCVPVYLLLL